MSEVRKAEVTLARCRRGHFYILWTDDSKCTICLFDGAIALANLLSEQRQTLFKLIASNATEMSEYLNKIRPASETIPPDLVNLLERQGLDILHVMREQDAALAEMNKKNQERLKG